MLSKGNNNFHRGIKSVRIAVCELGVEIAALPFLYCKYSIQETPLFLVISHEWIPFFDFFNISRIERIRAPYRIWGLCLLANGLSKICSICNSALFTIANVTRAPSVWTSSSCVDICLAPSDASVFPPLPHLLSLPHFLMCRRETQLSTSFESPW